MIINCLIISERNFSYLTFNSSLIIHFCEFYCETQFDSYNSRHNLSPGIFHHNRNRRRANSSKRKCTIGNGEIARVKVETSNPFRTFFSNSWKRVFSFSKTLQKLRESGKSNVKTLALTTNNVTPFSKVNSLFIHLSISLLKNSMNPLKEILWR